MTQESQGGAAVAETPAIENKYRVTLKADTPIAHPSLVVKAIGEEDARQKFMAKNGISGSECEWTIEQVK